MKKTLLTIITFCSMLCAAAQQFVVIGRQEKVFDEPNAKYVTTNKTDDEVMLQPGMAFKQGDSKAGWSLIEYTPGLRGYVPNDCFVKSVVMPVAGTYYVANNPAENCVITQDGASWQLVSGSKTLSGKKEGMVIVFYNEFGNPAYTLTAFGGKTYLFSYDNSLTKFL